MVPLRTDDLKRWISARGSTWFASRREALTRPAPRPAARRLAAEPEGVYGDPAAGRRRLPAVRPPVGVEGGGYVGMEGSGCGPPRGGSSSSRRSTSHPPLGVEVPRSQGDPATLTGARWWGHEMATILTVLAGSSDVPVLIAGDFNMPADDSTMAALRTLFRSPSRKPARGYGYTRRPNPWSGSTTF